MGKARSLIALVAGVGLVGQVCVHPQPAEAGTGAAVAAGLGGLMLGIIAGGALAQQRPGYHQAPRQRVVRPARPRVVVSSANIAVQKALTWAGVYHGPINGVMDSATRNAVRQLQAKIGEPQTGSLTAMQRRRLLTLYAERGTQEPGSAAATPNNPASIFAVIAGGAAAQGAAAPPQPGAVEPKTAAAPPPPAFEARSPDAFRLACADGADTSAPQPVAAGDLQTVAGALVPKQFCLARSSALLSARDAFTALQGIDASQIRIECIRIADSLASVANAAATDTPAILTKKLAKEFGSTPADQKAGAGSNFKICVGYGFADNSPNVVLASSLGLIGLGEGGYGEIVGAALALGAGVEASRPKAAAWLESAAAAIDGGATPVIKDGGVERAEILRLTAAELKAPQQVPKAQIARAAASKMTEKTALPSFTPVAIASTPATVKTSARDSTANASASKLFSDIAAPTPAMPAVSAPEPAVTAAVTPVTEPAAPSPDATEAVAAPPASTPPVAPPPATVVAAIAPTATEPAPLPRAGGRRAEAEAFFLAEQNVQAAKLDGLASALGLDAASLAPLCAAQAKVESPAPEAVLSMRLCRAYAYSIGDRAMMYRLDRALGELGDRDADGRIIHHLVLGDDRLASTAP